MKRFEPTLRGPLFVHGVRTGEEYREEQQRYIRRLQASRPALRIQAPAPVDATAPAFVIQGRWVIRCRQSRNGRPCGDYVVVDPDWRLGCCFACGAIYESLEIPPERETIEALLLARPNVLDRSWVSTDSLEDVRAMNRRLGVETDQEPL